MRTFSYSTCGFSEKEITQALLQINPNYKITKKDGYQEHTQKIFYADILVAEIF
jgi:hypothetical protein